VVRKGIGGEISPGPNGIHCTQAARSAPADRTFQASLVFS